jgi:predicted Na+-dependent transporter
MSVLFQLREKEYSVERWQALGRILGSHIVIIVPIALSIGILAPSSLSWLIPAVPVMFAVLTFQGSLNNTFHQVLEVFRRPKPLLLILATTLVIIPFIAHLLALVFFGGDANLVCGTTLEYATPIAVSAFMWLTMYEGNVSLGLAAILISTVLAPFTIPFTLKILMGQSVDVDVFTMMFDMIFEIALPALAGTALNERTHGWGKETLSPALSPACKILLPLIIGTNSTEISDQMHHMTPQMWGVMAFIGLFAFSSYLLGMALARATHQTQANFVTMCYTCGMRNISSGAVIAAAFFPAEVLFPVMMGTLFQQIIAASFGSIIARMSSHGQHHQKKAGAFLPAENS